MAPMTCLICSRSMPASPSATATRRQIPSSVRPKLWAILVKRGNPGDAGRLAWVMEDFRHRELFLAAMECVITVDGEVAPEERESFEVLENILREV